MAADSGTSERFDRLDALRGAAIVWMAAFHFSFDLNHAGLIWPPQNFYADPFWTGQRIAIVSSFLFCAGLAQAVALEGLSGASLAARFTPRFWNRWAQVAGCALLVSLGSAWMFPRSWISFGVLHAIALMTILLRVAAPLGRSLWLLGAVAALLPLAIQHPFFDTRLTNWIGLTTHKPVTEDYVPLLPWLAATLWGLAAGRWLLARHRHVLAGALPAALRPLAALGRWSLSFYMLHQPVLIGAITAWVAWRH